MSVGDALRMLVGRGENVVHFRCNLCGSANRCPESGLTREDATCKSCRSSVRMRAVVHHVSMAVFGESLALGDFPRRPEVRGIGLSDWPPYAEGFAKKFNYTNTYYHQEPFLDITSIPAGMAATCDFVVSTDVFEHVLPPVAKAFEGAFQLLKPGGTLVLTVPFMVEKPQTREHFPGLHRFEIRQDEAGRHRLINTTPDGEVQVFEDLVFHGGPGETLEMREFAKEALPLELERAGFTSIRFADEDYLPFGIHWKYPWSIPLIAKRPGGA